MGKGDSPRSCNFGQQDGEAPDVALDGEHAVGAAFERGPLPCRGVVHAVGRVGYVHALGGRVDEPCEPEIGYLADELRVDPVRDQYVAGGQVAVHDPYAAQEGHTLDNVEGKRARLVHRQCRDTLAALFDEEGKQA